MVDNGEIVDVTAAGARLQTLDGDPVDRDLLEITWDAGQAEQGGYPHFMLKEIHEQPQAVAETLSGRLLDGGAVDVWTRCTSRPASPAAWTESGSPPAAPPSTPAWWARRSWRACCGCRWRWPMPTSCATGTR